MFYGNIQQTHLTFLTVSAKGKGSGGVKTAKLYAWVALQSLPEEMVISPCLLDFLEKALETIPITPIERNYAGECAPADVPPSTCIPGGVPVLTRALCRHVYYHVVYSATMSNNRRTEKGLRDHRVLIYKSGHGVH